MNRDLKAALAEREERVRKKIFRMARNAAWAVGIGVGILLVRFVIPADAQSPETTSLFFRLGIVMIAYGGIILVSIPVLRAHALKVGMVMSWIVLPAIIARLVLDATGR